MVNSDRATLLGLIARIAIVYAMALVHGTALADIAVYRNLKEWREAADPAGTPPKEIDFFFREKDEITGNHLRPQTYRKLTVLGVTFEATSSPTSKFAINPYADPYAGVLFGDAGSTLRIAFGRGVKSFALLGLPSSLGAPSILVSGRASPYEFGANTAFIGFVSDKEPIEWIEFTPRERFDLDKVFFYPNNGDP